MPRRLFPTLALLVSLAFLSSAEMKNLIAGAVALVVGAVIYALRRRGGPDDRAPAAQSGFAAER